MDSYAPGYAQVIESPQQFQITPMQIDTWNRDKTPKAGEPGDAKFAPGPVPKTSLAPLHGPDARYSGLLECPLTTRVKAVVDSHYSLRSAETCGAAGGTDEVIQSAAECFAASAAEVGHNCTRQAAGSDPSRPAGCSVTARPDGACEA